MSSNGSFIHVVRPGLFTTIQDLGRRGYQRFGVSVSGAMDPWALTVGNRLLGNHDNAAGLEITLQGPELFFEQRLYIAITGADLSPTSDGRAIPMWTVVAMPAGSRLQFGLRKQGTRAYVTVAGGIELPLVLGSRSTHVRSGLGGLEGRALRKSDRLVAGPAPSAATSGVGRMLAPASQPRYVASPTLRVIPGPQADDFIEEALHVLMTSPYCVTSESDRMGYRLEGRVLPHRGSADIISEAVTAGNIQVPSNGQPILLMADCQTTGGYAKLATMIGADRHLAAQVGPGDRLSFVVITEQEASTLFRSWHAELDRILPPQKT
ncbi:MAG: biotin-dependent carboxyltransferase family protein [Nitrospira sp.]|nr:biotin-dependent carboxyltransferase family protein [Nitrospira sp.]